MHDYVRQTATVVREVQSAKAHRPPRVVVEDSIFRRRQRPRYRVGEWLVHFGHRLTGQPIPGSSLTPVT